jgi:hypothetical protein
MTHLFWDAVDRQGGRIRGVEKYPAGQTDFGKEIKSITGLNIPGEKGSEENRKPIVDFGALFIPDSISVVSMIAPQLAFYDVIGVHLLGTNIWNSSELLKKESEYFEGAVFHRLLFSEQYPSGGEDLHRPLLRGVEAGTGQCGGPCLRCDGHAGQSDRGR